MHTFFSNYSNKDPNEQLIEAAKMGDNFLISQLLNQGANINYQNTQKHTALLWAAHEGHLHTVKLLKETHETKADHNLADIDGNTPLHWAAFKGHIDIIKYFDELDENLILAVNKNKLDAIEFAKRNDVIIPPELFKLYRSANQFEYRN